MFSLTHHLLFFFKDVQTNKYIQKDKSLKFVVVAISQSHLPVIRYVVEYKCTIDKLPMAALTIVKVDLTPVHLLNCVASRERKENNVVRSCYN